MIAGPSSPLVLLFRRLARAHAARANARAPLEGGALVADDIRALPAPKDPLEAASALTPLPAGDPPMDILALPDRDHLRRVVPDYEHLEYVD